MPPVSIDRIPFILDGFLVEQMPDGTLISFQGQAFAPPDDGIWLRTTCKTGGMMGMEKGLDGYSRRSGIHMVDIFIPWPGSSLEAWKKAAEIEAAFRRKCIEGVYIEDPHSENMGVDKYNKFQVRTSVPWWCWAQ